MLNTGIKTPDFALENKDGKKVGLFSFLDRRVVSYSYPKDNTPGCIREACVFAGAYTGFKQKGAEVIGVNGGSEKSRTDLVAGHELSFILLSDSELTVVQVYDVWEEKRLYDKVSTRVVRSTCVIDGNGVTEKIFEKAKSDTNTQEILDHPDGEAE